MHHLVSLILAQAQAVAPIVPSDPVATLIATFSGGAGAVILWQLVKQFVGPFFDAWSVGIKRKLGDNELEAKMQTRAMIQGVTERVAEIARDQRLTAEAMRDIAKELVEFRRENEKAHDAILRGQA